jgi:hypothetical protein
MYNTHHAVSIEKKWRLIHLIKILYLFNLKTKKKSRQNRKERKSIGHWRLLCCIILAENVSCQAVVLDVFLYFI